jgi:uncharacterized membrane protein YraQ (UPF0718 family)
MQKPRRAAFDWSMAVITLIVVASAVTVYMRDGRGAFLTVLFGDLHLFVDMLPKVLAGCLIGALVTLLLPREIVARWVGPDSGFSGLIIATVAGMILPGGPLTIYPVAAAFLAAGADMGAVIAFVVSWTLLGYSRALVWEMPFMGIDFVLWRALAALGSPILAGVLGRIAAKAFAAAVPAATAPAAATRADAKDDLP